MSNHSNAMTRGMTTREKIVELGRQFIQHLGYHAFKYQLIAKELNIKNAAVHHYFPAKEDLGTAIIEKDQADFQALTESVKQEPPKARAEAFLHIYAVYNESGMNLCVIGACISAFSELPQKMGLAAKRYLDNIQNWLSSVFQEGLSTGEFHFEENPEELAALWVAALPGALQSAQARGAAHFQQVLSQLRRSLRM